MISVGVTGLRWDRDVRSGMNHNEQFRANVRPAAVAGRFYPGQADELREQVDELLEAAGEEVAGAKPSGVSTRLPKAIIVPHAGYMFSGAVAARAYARIQPGGEHINRVVLIGPAHTQQFYGLATSSADAFATPLGLVAVDQQAIAAARRVCPMLMAMDSAHEREHGLEVQLPFLQRCLERFEIVPIVFGMTSAGDVERVLATLWGGEETLIVVSSDLSHYLDSAAARRLDDTTAAAIEAMLPERIAEGQACGRLAIQGLLMEAQSHGLRPRRQDLRHSGETAPQVGTDDRVVGYGAWTFGGN